MTGVVFRIAIGLRCPEGIWANELKYKETRVFIRNQFMDEYMFLAFYDRINGDRVLEGSRNLGNRNIFRIISEPEGFVIIHENTQEYIFAAYNDRMNGDRVIEGYPKKKSNSYFAIGDLYSDKKGISIKCIEFDEYLFLAEGDRMNGDRIVESNSNLMKKSIWEIIKIY